MLIVSITTNWQNFYIISISKRIILRSNQAFLRIGYAVAVVCHWGAFILCSYQLIAACYFYERLCIYFVYSMYIRNTYDGFRIGDRFDSIVSYWSKIHTLRLLLISFSTSFCKKYKWTFLVINIIIFYISFVNLTAISLGKIIDCLSLYPFEEKYALEQIQKAETIFMICVCYLLYDKGDFYCQIKFEDGKTISIGDCILLLI